jgi:phosphoglycolate phosphatase
MAACSTIIFDLDGTLVDTSGDIVRVVNQVLTERGLGPMDPVDVMSHVGYGTLHLLRAVIGHDPSEQEVAEARARFVEVYAKDPAQDSHLYPGVRETLDALVTGRSMAVVSNKAGKLVRATIESVDLTGYFHPVLGGDELGQLKPAPDGLLEAMRVRDGRPESTVMVGDMNLDVLAGKAAGTRTVFATYGFGALREGDPEPDGVIDAFAELTKWV